MESPPVLHQLNIITRDWEATLAFYRLLGLDVHDGGEYPPGSGARHASVLTGGLSLSLEFDNRTMQRRYAPDLDPERGPIVGFALPSADAVDATHARLIAAGHPSLLAPNDAFWGARYAIVQDPNGTPIGLMGPRQ